jgi:hypothetical protein
MKRKKKALRKPNASYVLPLKVQPCDKYVIGLDPGSRNFGIAAIGIKGTKVFVAATSVLTNPLNDMVNVNKPRADFLAEIERWVSLFQPVAFVGERFQTRGNSGPLIEYCSLMLGLVAGAYPSLPFKLTIASAWKNRVQKRFGKSLRDDVYPVSSAEAHQIDAALIGVFGFESGLGLELPYDLDDIVKQVEETNLKKVKP